MHGAALRLCPCPAPPRRVVVTARTGERDESDHLDDSDRQGARAAPGGGAARVAAEDVPRGRRLGGRIRVLAGLLDTEHRSLSTSGWHRSRGLHRLVVGRAVCGDGGGGARAQERTVATVPGVGRVGRDGRAGSGQCAVAPGRGRHPLARDRCDRFPCRILEPGGLSLRRDRGGQHCAVLPTPLARCLLGVRHRRSCPAPARESAQVGVAGGLGGGRWVSSAPPGPARGRIRRRAAAGGRNGAAWQVEVCLAGY